MTLKTRNFLWFVFFVFSCLAASFYAVFFFIAYFKGAIVPPENFIRDFFADASSPAFQFSFPASLISIVIFIIYVPVCFFMLRHQFEKTQSNEVIYFSVFLFSCLAETVRFLLPLFGLWKTYSSLYFFTGRCVFAGRFLGPLSLLFAALFSETEHRQTVEKYSAIIILSSLFFANLVPLDTSNISSTCTVWWGFSSLFSVMRGCVFLATMITLILNAFKKDSTNLKINTAGYVLLFTGYSLLQVSDCWVLLLTSVPLFIAGNIIYLKSNHAIYSWK